MQAIRLSQSYAAINAQVNAQAETISKLNRRIEQLSTQHLQDHTRWETERFTSSRMTDALLAHARAEGGVRTEHLERECARALEDNFSLQNRLQEAQARSRAAEEQLMMLRPYVLYGHGEVSKTHYPMASTKVAPPHYLSAASLPYRPPINMQSQHTRPVTATGFIFSGSASTGNKPRGAHSSSDLDDIAKDITSPGSKPESAQGRYGTPTPSNITVKGGATKSPDSLDYLISAARRVLDTEHIPNSPTVLSEPSKNRKIEELLARDEVSTKSALDVLVAAAFADHSRDEDEAEIDVTAEAQPSPRRSQRNRAKRDPTISRSTPFIGTDDGKEIQMLSSDDRLPSRGRPRGFTNQPGTEMETGASARSLALPAFMNFKPDYKNVPCTTASSSTPAVAPIYPRSPLVPFYQPQIPALYTRAVGTSPQVNSLLSSSLAGYARMTPAASSSGHGFSTIEPSAPGLRSPRPRREPSAAPRESSTLSPSKRGARDPVEAEIKGKTPQGRNKTMPPSRTLQSEKPRRARLDHSTAEDEEHDEGRPTKRKRDQTPEGDSQTADNSVSPNTSPVCGPSLLSPQA